MDQAAEPVASSDADVVVGRRDMGPAVGWSVADGPVRPVGVVVIDLFAERVVQMPSAGDEDAVGALASGGGDPTLADRVRARRPDRRGDDAHAARGEDRVEPVGVLGVPVPDQELQALGSLPEMHQHVPGLLHHPGGGGMSGNPGQVDAAVMVLDDEQHVEPAQEDGVDVEVDCCDRLGLGGQELLPAGGCALRGGVDAGGLEDLPDSRGRDLVAEAGQLAADPPVASGRVVAGHLQHKPADRRSGARPSGCPMPVGPEAPDQIRVPAQERAGGDDQGQLAAVRGRQVPGKAGHDCPVGPGQAG